MKIYGLESLHAGAIERRPLMVEPFVADLARVAARTLDATAQDFPKEDGK